MIDFDDFEEQELRVSDVAEPEGAEEALPEVPGFQPARHEGGSGSGGKLRLLCFHGSRSNAALMERQMHVLFATHTGSQTTWLDALAEWECLDGPLQMPEFVDVPPSPVEQESDQPSRKRVLEEGLGPPRAWYEKELLGSPQERWSGLQEAIDVAIRSIQERAPLDGLCGFGEGGELVCQLARLAEEGHAELQGAFKFVMTKAARWPKLGNGDGLRPKRPLEIPALHLCELSHRIYSPPDFEDMILHWHPDAREVIWLEREKIAPGGHKPGMPKPKRRPAKLAGDNLDRARRFLTAFQTEGRERWRPHAASAADALAGLTLPVPRCREAVLTTPSPSRPLQLLCFHDTDGTLGGGELNCRIWDAVRKSALHTPLANCLDIEAPNLARLMGFQGDITGDAPSSAALPRHHAVSQQAAELAGKLAEKVLMESSFDMRPTVFAGIGLGAYFALQCAAALREHGGHPWRLYAIKPVASFPVPMRGSLGGCGVRCLLHPWDTSGERWRLALATRGPCRVELLDHAYHCAAGAPMAYDPTGGDAEGTLPWAQALVDDLLAAFDWH
mmetsp:Transcript_116797/g.341984  ORF Transcript_116797/g.341984 Transcript_116797/m.341984 type:complete len:559 (+) Transcript_116797:65-1741(+)